MEVYMRKTDKEIGFTRPSHNEGDAFSVVEDGKGRIPAKKSVFCLVKFPGIKQNDPGPDGIQTWEQYLLEPLYDESTVDSKTAEVVPGKLIYRKKRRFIRDTEAEVTLNEKLTVDEKTTLDSLKTEDKAVLEKLALDRVVEAPTSMLYSLVSEKEVVTEEVISKM